MLCNDVIGGLILYTTPPCRSSKIFATRVFWRLRNHTFDGHISGLDQDRDNLKPLLPTSRLRPIDWYQCRVCHVTILLPVWRFWRFRVIQTVGKAAIMMSSVVGHGEGACLGPPSAGALTPSTPILQGQYESENISGCVARRSTEISGIVAGDEPGPWADGLKFLTKGN